MISKPIRGALVNPSHIFAPNLGCWLMNENGGDIVADLSGNGNHGTFISSPTWTSNGEGPAIDFDGSADYISIPSPITNNKSFWIAISFRWDGSGVNDWLIDNGDGTNGGFQILTLTTNELRGRIDDSGANGGVFDTISTVNDGKWHQVILSVDKSGTAKLYLDGLQDGGTLDISGYGNISGSANFRICASIGVNPNWQGGVSYVLAKQGVITSDDAMSIYSDPYQIFDTGFNPAIFGGLVTAVDVVLFRRRMEAC